MEIVVILFVAALVCEGIYLHFNPPTVVSEVAKIEKRFRSNRGIIGNWWLIKQAGWQTQARQAVTHLQESIIDSHHNVTNKAELLQSGHHFTMSQTAAGTAVHESMADRKLDPMSFGQVRINEEAEKSKQDTYRANKAVDREEHKEHKELDVEGSITAKNIQAHEIEDLTKKYAQASKDWEHWNQQPDSPTRTRMLKRLGKNLKLLDEAIDARGEGLIQGNNWQNMGADVDD